MKYGMRQIILPIEKRVGRFVNRQFSMIFASMPSTAKDLYKFAGNVARTVSRYLARAEQAKRRDHVEGG